MLTVSNELTVLEIDGKVCAVPAPRLGVHSHWNRTSCVVLVVEGKHYTVSAKELEAAIKNATNTAKYG